MLLPDHIVIKNRADFLRRGNAVTRLHQRGFVFLANDVHAEFNTFVADKDGRPGNQLPDLMLAFAAKGTVERVLGVAAAHLTHKNSLVTHGPYPAHQDQCTKTVPAFQSPIKEPLCSFTNGVPKTQIQTCLLSIHTSMLSGGGSTFHYPEPPGPRFRREVNPAFARPGSRQTGLGKTAIVRGKHAKRSYFQAYFVVSVGRATPTWSMMPNS